VGDIQCCEWKQERNRAGLIYRVFNEKGEI